MTPDDIQEDLAEIEYKEMQREMVKRREVSEEEVSNSEVRGTRSDSLFMEYEMLEFHSLDTWIGTLSVQQLNVKEQ